MIGNTQELSQNHCFLGASWLLDVDKLKSLPQPMKPDGNLRKSRIHYADVKPPYVVIHSEPVRFSMLNLFEYSLFGFPDAEGVQNLFDEFEKFWEFCSFLHRTSAGLLIPDYQTV
jgi:hypothetical protein